MFLFYSHPIAHALDFELSSYTMEDFARAAVFGKKIIDIINAFGV